MKTNPSGKKIILSQEDQGSHYVRSLIEASLNPLLTISPGGKIIDVNKASTKVFGVSREKLIGTDFLHYFTEPVKTSEVCEQVFAKGSVADFHLHLRPYDGKLIEVLINGTVYNDDTGNALGAIVVMRNLTEQKAFENIIANKGLDFQDKEKEKRAGELIIANKELIFQNEEKEKRAAELIVANKELVFQNEEKEKRAAELIIANKELIFQNEEKEKRAAELFIANQELVFQTGEKAKRAAELVIANIELDFQNIEKGKREIASKELEAFSYSLKQASLYARSLIEASTDPLVTISPEGKITDVNEASIKVTGVSRAKLIGTDFSDYFTEPEKARDSYKKVFEKSFVSDYPLTIRHKNGKLTDVLYNASVYKDDKDNVLGVFAAARDVTAQKLLSKYSLSLIEASRDPLVTISIEGKITDMNQATAKITGLSRKELTGTDFFNYFTEPQKAREVYQEVFAKGSVSDSPLTLRHKDGKLTDVLFNGSVYLDDGGNVLGVVIVARDVTSQKKLERDVAEREKEMERLVELERFRKLTVGRELKMIELKKENEELRLRLGITRDEYN